MKAISTIGAPIVVLLLACGSAEAIPILDVSGSVSATDPTQLGRLSRNGVPQDWTGGEPFPGIVNPTTVYHYTTFTVNVDDTPFIQIEFDSVSPNTFVSAYDTAYLPDSAGPPNFGFNTNWLGDPGFSGNFFGTDPLFFQVIVPAHHTLVVVINNTLAGNGGVGDPFNLLVEGFIDTEFTEPVPEPATLVLSAIGLALVALRRSRARARG
jgi:hypothetical protein